MASWWSMAADLLGAYYPNIGSAAKRIAYKLDAVDTPGNSWAEKIATKLGVDYKDVENGRWFYDQVLSGEIGGGGGPTLGTDGMMNFSNPAASGLLLLLEDI